MKKADLINKWKSEGHSDEVIQKRLAKLRARQAAKRQATPAPQPSASLMPTPQQKPSKTPTVLAVIALLLALATGGLIFKTHSDTQTALTKLDTTLKTQITQLTDEIEKSDQRFQQHAKKTNDHISRLDAVSKIMDQEIHQRVKTDSVIDLIESHKIDVIEQAQKNVVYVVSNGGNGSGFFVNDSGRALTNCHVVKNNDEVELMTWDEHWIRARVDCRDAASDLAVLQVVEEDLSLLRSKGVLPTGVTLANSDEVAVGDTVFVMGAPHNLTQTVNSGQVSNTSRYLSGLQVNDKISGLYNLYMQVDAGVMPGNSGGPTFNMKGEAIGINTRANYQNESEGFVMPINYAVERMQSLLDSPDKTNHYNTLGFDINPYMKRTYEVGVRPKVLPEGRETAYQLGRVFQDSPAYIAGFRTGDIILEMNGQSSELTVMGDVVDVRRAIAFGEPGTPYKIEVIHYPKYDIRNGKILKEGATEVLEIEVISDTEYSQPSPYASFRFWANDVPQKDLPKNVTGGVKVIEWFNNVEMQKNRNVASANYKMMPGDILVAIDSTPITCRTDLNTAITPMVATRQVPNSVTVYRKGKKMVLNRLTNARSR